MTRQLQLGNVTLGATARVVGTISTVAGLRSLDAGRQLPCDIVELRLDKFGADQPWTAACRTAGVPVIVTIRPDWEGGGWAQPEEERAGLFQTALAHAAAIDVEAGSKLLGSLAQAARASGKLLIASYHDFKRTPAIAELREVVAGCLRAGAGIVKIATMIAGDADMETLLELLKKPAAPLCVLGMGERAAETRRLFPKLGSVLTYGYLDEPVAPGQPSVRELIA
jgi:3-dehydroquinate dehydratase-1